MVPPVLEAAPMAVSKNQEPIQKKWIVLACFIGEVRDRVICVVERETKPWKLKGQTWVVFETLEEGEDPHTAVFRALREELDLADRDAVESVNEAGSFLLDVEAERQRVIFEAMVFLVQLAKGTKITQIVDSGHELEWRGMRQVNSLNWDTRPGTLLALRMALGSQNSRLPPPTIHVRNGQEIRR